MKLVNYESQEQLNTINGQIHNYANEIAYGADQSGCVASPMELLILTNNTKRNLMKI